jgi:hypothetical protein
MITDRFKTILILAEEFDETPRFSHEEYTPAASGFETLVRYYYVRTTEIDDAILQVHFPIGGQLGFRTWWILHPHPKQIAPGFWEIAVTFKGWAGTKQPVITVGASAESQSATNVKFPRYIGDTVGKIFQKAQTHENLPTMRVSYLVENVQEEKQTEKVGTALDPPVELAVPPSIWNFLNKYVYHWPNGWVLMESAQDRLPGCNAAFVTDSFRYIRTYTPG